MLVVVFAVEAIIELIIRGIINITQKRVYIPKEGVRSFYPVWSNLGRLIIRSLHNPFNFDYSDYVVIKPSYKRLRYTPKEIDILFTAHLGREAIKIGTQRIITGVLLLIPFSIVLYIVITNYDYWILANLAFWAIFEAFLHCLSLYLGG
jgi:hypothetical protein